MPQQVILRELDVRDIMGGEILELHEQPPTFMHEECIQDGGAAVARSGLSGSKNGAFTIFSPTFHNTWTPESAVFMCTTTRHCYGTGIMQPTICMMILLTTFATSACCDLGHKDQAPSPRCYLMPVAGRGDLESAVRGSGSAASGRERYHSFRSDLSMLVRHIFMDECSPTKTLELLVIPGDSSPGQDLQITLHDSLLSPSATAHNLGVTMHNELSFFPHVANVARSCKFLLYNIQRIRPFLSIQAAQVLVQSLVISRLDYCNSLLAGLPLNAIRPLQMIQNAAARLVFNQPKFPHTTPLLRSLHWLPVAAHIRFNTLMLAYKAKNGPAPSYLSDLIISYTAPRCLRSSSTARLVPLSLRMRGVASSLKLPTLRELDVGDSMGSQIVELHCCPWRSELIYRGSQKEDLKQTLDEDLSATRPTISTIKLQPCVFELCKFFSQCLCRGFSPKTSLQRYCIDSHFWYEKHTVEICKRVKRITFSKTVNRLDGSKEQRCEHPQKTFNYRLKDT
ncbi:hypothetical protein C0J45_17347 [Silurus meridionalis]|nr:hypothetical protein C0J45_17347 [Silurus meridionalis]